MFGYLFRKKITKVVPYISLSEAEGYLALLDDIINSSNMEPASINSMRTIYNLLEIMIDESRDDAELHGEEEEIFIFPVDENIRLIASVRDIIYPSSETEQNQGIFSMVIQYLNGFNFFNRHSSVDEARVHIKGVEANKYMNEVEGDEYKVDESVLRTVLATPQSSYQRGILGDIEEHHQGFHDNILPLSIYTYK